MAGAGAVAGVPCQIQSTTAITGGTRVTFLWEDNDGEEHTSSIDVMDGDKGDTGATGKGIKSVAVNASNHVIVTLDDNTEIDAGEIKLDSCVKKTDLEAVTLYVDYENGDDTNDGSTAEKAVKTVEAAYALCPINTALTLVLCSDYEGAVVDTNGLIPKLVITSVDTENPVTINGRLTIQNKVNVDISYINVITTISASENSVSLSAVTRAYFKNINIKHINKYDDNKGNGFRLTNVSNATFISNVTVEMDSSSTKRGNASFILDNSTCYISGTCQASGFARVVTLNNGSVLNTISAFIDNSTSYLGKILTSATTSGSYYFLDGKLRAQPIPECPATTDGTFVLKATVSSGAVTYNWVAET